MVVCYIRYRTQVGSFTMHSGLTPFNLGSLYPQYTFFLTFSSLFYSNLTYIKCFQNKREA